MTDEQDRDDRSVDGPTAHAASAGELAGPTDEPTIADLAAAYGPTAYRPTTDAQAPPEPTRPDSVDGPTVAEPLADNGPTSHPTSIDGPTIAEPLTGSEPTGHYQPADAPTWSSGPTAAFPFDEPGSDHTGLVHGGLVPGTDDEPTAAVGTDDPTTTGPTVGGWPFDEFEPPPPTDLVWQPESPAPPATHRPAYYVSLGAAVVLVIGLVALAAVVTVMRPGHAIAGSAVAAGGGVPQITPSGQPTTTATTTAQGPFADLAAHPLSSSTVRMADTTCALPRFDPANDKQAAFYTAAKVCADDAWRNVLRQAGLQGEVKVVTVTGAVTTESCGDLAPTSPSTECDGTVYLTPAYLRDTEQNGRYPGRYLGVFLREYARALQNATGLDELVGAVTTGSAADLDTRVDQQATCLAGVVSGAMAGRGAIDTNITGEIRSRLTTVDAPKDAQSWLDKGFQQRTPAACDVWLS